jgi:hypothetical protein
MKHRHVALQFFLNGVTCLLFFCTLSSRAQVANEKLQVSIKTGYFHEDFRWSIAGITSNSNYVNVLSELRWKNLRGPSIQASARYVFSNNIFILTDFSESFIIGGRNTDTDFGQSNRQDPVYFDSFNSNKGHVLGGFIAGGYQVKFKKVALSHYIGYGAHNESLYILRDYGNVIGNLRSTYKTIWYGFTGGFDIKILVRKRFIILPNIIYHQVNYAAKANWNLIQEFKHPVSYRHSAKGFGIEPGLNVSYVLNKKISFSIGGKYSYWMTGKGKDTLYLTDNTTSITQMNGAIGKNYSVTGGVTLSF